MDRPVKVDDLVRKFFDDYPPISERWKLLPEDIQANEIIKLYEHLVCGQPEEEALEQFGQSILHLAAYLPN